MEMVEKLRKEIEILQFLVDQNGKCTHAEYVKLFNPSGPLEITHKDLFRCGYIDDENGEYIITPRGRGHIAELGSQVNFLTEPPQDS